tara:strand:+ start:805 stop:1470 length:666 start_codon:yes stop_codon:yes gene_type:complete
MARKFTMGDFIHSDIANDKKINNTPGVDVNSLGTDASKENIVNSARILFKKCLGPLKQHFPTLAISSGFRCKRLNRIVKGVSDSNHLFGEAADIYDPTGQFETLDIFTWILGNIPDFYQVIWEYPERGRSRIRSGGTLTDTATHSVNSWVHLAYVEGDNKKTISLASDRESLHKQYKRSYTSRSGSGTYTHYLKKSDFLTIEQIRSYPPLGGTQQFDPTVF